MGARSLDAWSDVLAPGDREVIERAGYGRALTLAGRLALVCVDFQHAYLGRDAPILEQLGEWPTGGGERAWAACRAVVPLVERARERHVPVVLTRIAYPVAGTGDPFALKRGAQRQLTEGERGTEIADLLQPQGGDHVITKRAASAFLDTDLHSYLQQRRVDSVMVCGLSTSGCVRATVVDGAARGYRMAVVEAGTADRIHVSHRVALLDMWLKYAGILDTDEALSRIDLESRASRS